MDTNQIYALVNDVTAQALGRTDLAVANADSLVSLGNTILSSNNNVEAFLNTLVQRIGRTIFAYREYRNKLGDMTIDDFEYGQIVQKVSFKLPKSYEDPSFDLTDGSAVDPWTIYKPEVLQKLFVIRTPYMFAVTIARTQLKEAFSNEGALSGFIGGIFGQMRNAIEFSLEQLGRTCLSNFIAETTHIVNLVTDFNTELGLTGTDRLTATTALHSDLFLNYAIGRINHHAKMMTEMSVRYNDASVERFTPEDKRVIRLLSDFDTRAQTVTQYAAYHERFVSVGGVWDSIAYWQNFKEGNEKNISVKRASDGTNKTVNNIIAVAYDRDALGIYKKDEEVLTTGVNAKARYYTTYYHEQEMWFNDLSENFVAFTLN